MERSQRITKVGGSSMIALPVEWVRFKKLGPGREVSVAWDDDSVTIRPKAKA
jgi:antitoxin component of MazEF toxin-antitoxin module